MEENFWKRLKKPIFALAPMDDVTDFPFRRALKKACIFGFFVL